MEADRVTAQRPGRDRRILSPALGPVCRLCPRAGAGVKADFPVKFASLAPGPDGAAVRAAVDRVIGRGWFVLGPEVEAFESEFAGAMGAVHAVGVGTGTGAIALILRALGIGRGDEGITTPLSAAYTALAVMTTGAPPVFADIDPVRL